MFIADQFKNWDATACINDKWVFARPIRFSGLYGLRCRIKDAYQVLIGKADAVKFIGQ